MKIALDAMGGDFAPRATVEGAVMAARELGLEVVLVGDQEKIERELKDYDTAGLKLSVAHASQVVEMGDSPVESLLTKPDSSIHRCFDLYKAGQVDAVVSAGNSGAVMAAGMAILGTLPGVERPAIASAVPSGDSFVLLLDAGANVEVKPHHLAQFAAMGSAYWRYVANVTNPRVGILSNGEEDSKGTELTRAAAAILRQMDRHINYVGYVEGRDINHFKADVIVTDGFTGNVALKTMEGFAEFAVANVRALFGDSIRGRIAYLLIRRQFAKMRRALDKSEYGGAPLLGISGVAFVAHGSSNARAIRNALRVAANESVVKQVNQEIMRLIQEIPSDFRAKAPAKGFKSLFSRMRERLHRHPRSDGHKTGELTPPHAHEPTTVASATGNDPAHSPQNQQHSASELFDSQSLNHKGQGQTVSSKAHGKSQLDDQMHSPGKDITERKEKPEQRERAPERS